jgi:hypothetical protein
MPTLKDCTLMASVLRAFVPRRLTAPMVAHSGCRICRQGTLAVQSLLTRWLCPRPRDAGPSPRNGLLECRRVERIGALVSPWTSRSGGAGLALETEGRTTLSAPSTSSCGHLRVYVEPCVMGEVLRSGILRLWQSPHPPGPEAPSASDRGAGQPWM